MTNAVVAPIVIPAMLSPNDPSKKQYGIGLVYGSILEFAGGSVVQNAEIVANSKVAYKKKSQRSSAQRSTPTGLSLGQEKRTTTFTCCTLSFISSLVVFQAGV